MGIRCSAKLIYGIYIHEHIDWQILLNSELEITDYYDHIFLYIEESEINSDYQAVIIDNLAVNHSWNSKLQDFCKVHAIKWEEPHYYFISHFT
jgi:hypothetical protein